MVPCGYAQRGAGVLSVLEVHPPPPPPPIRGNRRSQTLVDVWMLDDGATTVLHKLLNSNHPPQIEFSTGLLESRTQETVLALAVASVLEADGVRHLRQRVEDQRRAVGHRQVLVACPFTLDNCRALVRLPVHDVHFYDRQSVGSLHDAILKAASWHPLQVILELEVRGADLPWEFIALVRTLARNFDDSPTKPMSGPQLAQYIGCSPSHLTRICAEIGVTPGHVRRTLAFLTAHALSLQGYTWTRAALSVGYGSLGALSRMVSNLTGVSPTETESTPTRVWAQRLFWSHFDSPQDEVSTAAHPPLPISSA